MYENPFHVSTLLIKELCRTSASNGGAGGGAKTREIIEVSYPRQLTIQGISTFVRISTTTLQTAFDGADVERSGRGQSKEFTPHQVHR